MYKFIDKGVLILDYIFHYSTVSDELRSKDPKVRDELCESVLLRLLGITLVSVVLYNANTN